MSSDFFKVKKGLNIQPTDPSGLSDLQDGDIVIDSTAGNSMKIYSTDAGGFSEVGTGSGINYIDNNSFDGGVTGWTGDTNLVISKEDVAPLRGTGSLKIAKGAVDASGEQVYTDFTIDAADLAKRLTITFDIDASDANYSDDDMIVKIIKDPTGTPVEIAVNGAEIKGGKFQYIGQFQTDATELDYRLVIEQVSTQASAVNLVIDNVSVGPREVAIGPVVTDWIEAGTITIDAATSSPVKGTTNVDLVRYKRVGQNAIIEFKYEQITAGSAGSGTYHFAMPDGLKIDTSLTSSGGNQVKSSVESTAVLQVSSSEYQGNVSVRDENSVYFAFKDSISNSTFQSSTFAALSNSLMNIAVQITVPIQGWSANTKMSEDLGGREVVVSLQEALSQSITDNSVDKLLFTSPTIYNDTTSSWDNTNSKYIIPESGFYDFHCGVNFGVGADDGSNGGTEIRINNVVPNNGGNIVGLTSGNTNIVTHSFSSYAEKGDEVELFAYFNDIAGSGPVTISGARIIVAKRSSPQTILETETVAARYTSNNGQAIDASFLNVVFEDKEIDTHNAYNSSTGIYTVPVSGYYNICTSIRTASVAWSANNQTLITIYINQSTEEVLNQVFAESAGTRSMTIPANTITYLNKGDEVEIRRQCSISTTLESNKRGNFFSIARIK